MPQSRFEKMRERMSKDKPKIPEKISDHCLGKCDPQMCGFDDDKKPIIHCFGCGRKLG